ncbi:MAG: hypothetical protein A2Y79_06250 [Deltaproteobacteria bacterium RBG_13_43_22]|nr:MAG: hypothetical protein A2Y79_06250 [Deltaproteobacteria bacterium RBG_13_43_22]
MAEKIKEENGIALVTVILMLLALSVIGIIAVNLTNVGRKITSNTKTTKEAFYVAEAGVERARELLRTRMAGGSTLNSELNSVKGPDGVLVNSDNAAAFSATDDLPYINTTSMGTESFKVYLTNDAVDGVTSTTDTNSIVTLTSFGYGPDNSEAIIQTAIQRVPIPTLPGAITMPGPDVSFAGGDSNSSTYNGGATHPAIAVNSSAGQTSVINGIPSNRRDNYTGGGLSTPSVQNTGFSDPWGNLPQLQTLYNNLSSLADFTSPTDPGFTLGTTADPKVVVIDSNYSMTGGASGAGILLVTGDLTLSGNISYDGILLLIGKGKIIRDGGGTGLISGGIYVANIAGPDGNINTTADNTWGIPTWNTSGGGTSDIDYVFSTESSALQLLPFARTSWKQLNR